MSAPDHAKPRLRIPVPLPSPWFWGLVVLYVLLGLVGHDPWKSDDAIGFGIAWSMAGGGARDWLLPNVAGQAVAEEGPLAFWLAALFVQWFGGLLQPHDAARLATGVWMSACVLGVHRAARALDGAAAGKLAVLALLACVGLLARSHDIAAEPALLAGWAWMLWAMAHRGSDTRAGLIMAAGTGAVLLARGWSSALPLLLTGLAWTAVLIGRRQWPHALAIVLGAAAGAAAYAAWWQAAAAADPAYARAHLDWQAAQVALPDAAAWRYYGKTLLWFCFPAWPAALWWLAKRRPPMLLDVRPVPLAQPLPIVAAGACAVALAWSGNASDAVLLPLLPPLAILVAPGLAYMRRGQAALIDWFGRITFTLVAALIWLGYAALAVGWPPRVAANFERLEPGFVPSMHWTGLVIAVTATLAWTVAIARSERTPLRGIVHWCYGTTLAWLLLMTLWLPWIDYGRSYRPVALALKAALASRQEPASACVHTASLGLAERASIAYFGAVRFGAPRAPCRWLLTQGTRGEAPPVPPGLRLIWQGNRPGDRNERFRLYLRTP
ncbi:MAG: glycosyltransferase family 39 protein [Burkholderiales bacterium]|nr:glycosyltransferase family 39 protein [Burkholderiales bacterium]